MAFCARLLFSAHCTLVPYQNRAPHSDSKKMERNSQSTTFSQHEKPKFNIQSFKHKSNTDKALPSQSTIRRTKRYGHKPSRHKDHNNTKPIWKIIVLCNAPCFKLKSKKTAKNNPSRIVIPSKTAKKFLIYYLQPTWKTRFQHSKIETRVQHAHPKNISKKASLCTQTGKTHAHAEAAKNPKTKAMNARARK